MIGVPTGNIYEGEWKDKKRHGKGKFFYKTGELYGELYCVYAASFLNSFLHVIIRRICRWRLGKQQNACRLW